MMAEEKKEIEIITSSDSSSDDDSDSSEDSSSSSDDEAPASNENHKENNIVEEKVEDSIKEEKVSTEQLKVPEVIQEEVSPEKMVVVLMESDNEEMKDELKEEFDEEMEEDILEEGYLNSDEENDAQYPSPPVRTSMAWLDDRPPKSAQNMSFTSRARLLVPTPEPTPISYFQLYFSESFFNLILCETNRYAMEIFLKEARAKLSRWKDVTRGELEIFLGLMLTTSLYCPPDIPDLWKRVKYVFDFPTFYNAMSRERFLLILSALQFGSCPENGKCSTDPLDKVRPLLDLFEEKRRQVYYPGKHLTVAESTMALRGQLSFRHSQRSKPHPQGVKFYALVEPNGYVVDLQVFTKDSKEEESNGSEKLVQKLMRRYFNKGHSLYLGSSYNSIDLSAEFLKKFTYMTGPIKIKGNVPKSLVNKPLRKGELASMFTQDGMCLMKWRSKRNVLVLSTEHGPDLVEGKGKRIVPEMVAKYDQYARGIGALDQLLSFYPIRNTAIKWHKQVALHTIQLMVLNSFVLYKTFSGAKGVTYKNFIIGVIQELLSRNAPPDPWVNPPKRPRLSPHVPTFHDSRKRCRECYKKRLRKEVRTICPDCEDLPGLCLPECFRMFHGY